MNYTYLLKCADRTLYCGWTNDLDKRVKAHNEGKGAKYTKPRRPVTLVYFEEFDTKEEAMRREAAIKRLTRVQKEALIAGQAEEADCFTTAERVHMGEFKNIEFLEDRLRYRKWMKWQELPYCEIVKAYRQIEEAKGKVCCGTAYFEIHRVIFVTGTGEKIALEIPDRETGIAILDQLKNKNEQIEIGIKK